MSELPYMPFYISKYVGDTAHLTTLESGAYIALICTYWIRQKPLPDDPVKLARIAKLSTDEWSSMHETLAELFQVGGGVWKHKRVEVELTKAIEKVEKASISGRASGETRRNKRQADIEPLSNDRSTDVERTSNDRSTDVERTLNYKRRLEEKELGEADASLVNVAVAVAVAPNVVEVEFDRTPSAKRESLKHVGEWWNDLAGSLSLPQIEVIKAGSTREKQAWARCRAWLDDHAEVGEMTAFLAARIRGSPWLRGEKGFVCTFDWVMTASNFQKIFEGNYEIRQAQQRR